jgi:hypothetical protein
VGLPENERFVSLIHLGRGLQAREAPERAPLSDTVAYLD